jgi:Spy/CpxP family protein refolding chaperone
MQLSRLTTSMVLGVALGTVATLTIPHLINFKLPVSAQSFPNETPSAAEQAVPSSNDGEQRREARPKRMGQMFQRLNLTPEQIQKMRSIRQQYKDSIREQQRSVREARRAMQQNFGSASPSSAVLSEFQAVQQKQQSLNQLRFKSLLAIREVLTPTQRQQLAAQMMSRQDKLQRKNLLKKDE